MTTNEYTKEALETCWMLRQAFPEMTNREFADHLRNLDLTDADNLVHQAMHWGYSNAR